MSDINSVEDVVKECETYFNNPLDYGYHWDTLELIYALAKEVKNIKERVSVDD